MKTAEPQASASFHKPTSSLDRLSEYINRRETLRLEAAERHFKATRVKDLEAFDLRTLAEEARCECCSLPIESSAFKTLDSYSTLGLAFPLYFYFSRYIIAMLLIVSLVAAIPATISNYLLGTKSKFFFVNFSIAMHKEELPLWPIVLHLVAIILLCGVYAYMSLWMKAKMAMLDNGVYTPSDFAALVKGLGNNWNREELKNHIEENMKPDADTPLRVVDIIPCFDLAEYDSIKSKISKFKAKAERYFAQRSPSRLRRCWNALVTTLLCRARSVTAEDLKADMAQLDIELAVLGKKYWEKTGVAIVVFETNKQAKAFIKKWKRGIIRRYLCCCLSAIDEALYFNGKHIYLKSAPEPNDVLWKNLKFSRRIRVCLQFLAVIAVFIILFWNFTLLSFIADMKAGEKAREVALNGEASNYGDCEFDNSDPNPDPVKSAAFANYTQGESARFLFQPDSNPAHNGTAEYFPKGEKAEPEEPTKEEIEDCYPKHAWAISIFLAFGVTVLNIITKFLAQLISKYYEHHHTFTTEQLFLSCKLILFLSFNSIVAPLIVNYQLPDLNTEEGLTGDIFFLTPEQVGIAIGLMLLEHLIFWLKVNILSCCPCIRSFLSQKSLNAAFEYPEASISSWYVSLLCYFLLTLFYTPLIPVISPITWVVAVIDYLSKYQKLTYSRLPKAMNQRIPKTLMVFVKLGIVLYAVGMITTSMRTLSKQAEYICNAAVIISIAFFLLPVHFLKPCFANFLPHSGEEEEITYEEKAKSFILVSQQYDASNPALRVQKLSENSQDGSELKWLLFDQESSEGFARAQCRLQPQVADVRSVSSDYVRLSDARINS